MSSLRVDWCSYEAAKYAVERWHYSRTMPKSPTARLGIWEDDRFVGAVVFGMGSGNATHGKRYGLAATFQVAELQRVALQEHKTAVSRIIAISLRLLRRQSPGLRMVISFADPAEGHHGGIYQAGNWIFAGLTESVEEYLHRGRWVNRRVVVGGRFGGRCAFPDRGKSLPQRIRPSKYRYLMPLDAEMKERLEPLRKPYPKPCVRGADSGAAGDQLAGGGASPTRTLVQTARRIG